MDALAEVRNEETRLQDAYLLRVSSILAPLLRLLHLLLVVRVLVFIVITVIELDMWRPFCYRKKKAQKTQTRCSSHCTCGSSSGGSERSSAGLDRSCLCYFIAMRPLCRQELLVL
jgi:hypothetical protein